MSGGRCQRPPAEILYSWGRLAFSTRPEPLPSSNMLSLPLGEPADEISIDSDPGGAPALLSLRGVQISPAGNAARPRRKLTGRVIQQLSVTQRPLGLAQEGLQPRARGGRRPEKAAWEEFQGRGKAIVMLPMLSNQRFPAWLAHTSNTGLCRFSVFRRTLGQDSLGMD